MRLWLAGVLAISSAAAMAQTSPPPGCILPPAWSAWSGPAKSGREIVAGSLVQLDLHPAEQVKLPAASTHKAKPGSHAGVFTLKVADAGKLSIGLSDASYVDLLEVGTLLKSSAHRHGPECSTIKKIVTFDVQPGDHIVQISDAPGPSVRLLAVKE